MYSDKLSSRMFNRCTNNRSCPQDIVFSGNVHILAMYIIIVFSVAAIFASSTKFRHDLSVHNH